MGGATFDGYPISPWRQVGFGFGDDWFSHDQQHTGIDVAGRVGQAVYAIADGVVYNHTHDPKWGNGVVLDHGGWGTTYWHVDHFLPDGTQVKRGDQIATVYDLQGNTHLHFGVWVGKYDPNLAKGALPRAAWPDRFVDPTTHLTEGEDMTPEEHTLLAEVHQTLAKGGRLDAAVQYAINDPSVGLAAIKKSLDALLKDGGHGSSAQPLPDDVQAAIKVIADHLK